MLSGCFLRKDQLGDTRDWRDHEADKSSDGEDAPANATERIAFRQLINVAAAAYGAARAKRVAKKK